jgi:GT2 family glycosyltransferase
VRALADESVGVAEARQLPLEHPKDYDPVAGDTSWASTCCIVVRRSVFDALGGFDHDTFPLYCDDVDFSWRVRAAGHRVVVAPFATVFHDKRPRHDGVWPASDVEVYHSTLGRLMLATRWDRPDILDETVTWIEGNGAPMQVKALADFRARAVEGRVPAPVPGAAAVAQFVNGEYAVHRF